ncbi:hypothetical protein [Novosphingobium album (ex Liu et al. 2023)]|uniref:Uncharacterized protein n=1 Tax=Novosphingobium album (ex Liu et al. 2023) TaxID=3031130 RepID=A0ABT5WX55_9SPHN|nr:hypothetical protein [Novosphingobium album (ex Liu et al. 2023)]MDE8654452.1 hypothetical protein [Novosphingobium album (ex Liu et al. 2023)]
MRYAQAPTFTLLTLLATGPAIASISSPSVTESSTEVLAVVNEGADFVIVKRMAQETPSPTPVKQAAMQRIGSSVQLDAAVAYLATLPSALPTERKDHAQ